MAKTKAADETAGNRRAEELRELAQRLGFLGGAQLLPLFLAIGAVAVAYFRESAPPAVAAIAAGGMALGVVGVAIASSKTRARVVEALGAAALLEEERGAIERDRGEIRGSLDAYHGFLEKMNADIKRLSATFAKSLDEANAIHNETVRVSDSTGARHHEAEELLKRLEEEGHMAAQLQSDIRHLQEEFVRQQSLLEDRARRMQADEKALSDRSATVSKQEGAVAAGKEALQKQVSEAHQLRARLETEDVRLKDIQDRLEKDQAAVNAQQSRLSGLIETAHDIERKMDGHYVRLEGRLKEQDVRQTELDRHAAGLDERKLVYDRERVELDAKIHHLADLDQRNEQLLGIQAAQEEEKARLHTEFTEVRKNQKQTNDTWDELKVTLQRLEALEKRIQDTNDEIEALRKETERRDREVTEKLNRRGLALDKREREIITWRQNAELREREVQKHFNELEGLEVRKLDVLHHIEQLEQKQAERVAAFAREQEQKQNDWAERRAEAEKARELYERNMEILDLRVEEVVKREQTHEERAAALAKREAENVEKERLLRARDQALSALARQRDSLNSVIASLTTQIGKDWASPEVWSGSGLEPPAFDSPPPTGPQGNGGLQPPTGT